VIAASVTAANMSAGQRILAMRWRRVLPRRLHQGIGDGFCSSTMGLSAVIGRKDLRPCGRR